MNNFLDVSKMVWADCINFCVDPYFEIQFFNESEMNPLFVCSSYHKSNHKLEVESELTMVHLNSALTSIFLPHFRLAFLSKNFFCTFDGIHFTLYWSYLLLWINKSIVHITIHALLYPIGYRSTRAKRYGYHRRYQFHLTIFLVYCLNVPSSPFQFSECTLI